MHQNFVFASVKGDYGKSDYSLYKFAILIDVPKEIREQRVKNRSFQKFGKRMLPGGDYHKQEEAFFDFTKSRAENTVKEWAQTLSCPILQVNGTKSIEENTKVIIEHLQLLNLVH